MEKGKLKSKKKYISIMIVPHSSSGVKTLKLSAFYPKLIALLGMTLIALVTLLAIFAIRAHNENYYLKRNIEELSSFNANQRTLLEEKADEINIIIKKEESMDSLMEDFLSKYRLVTDTYITNRITSIKTSRSSGGDEKSIIKDLNELKGILDTINIASDAKKEYLDELSETEQKLRDYLDSMPTLWPVHGEISSDYGSRRDPFVWKKTFHDGIDIAADYGLNIKAAASGKVILAGWTSVYGRTVRIRHERGITTLYGHASKLLVKEGQTVEKGQVIARVGSSGRSTGAHLHFQIEINGTPTDPLKYLDKN